MRRGVVVQARLDSTRFPAKALAPLAGKPMLQHVIERASRIAGMDDLVLATSDRPVDDPIAELGERLGVAVFRGAFSDLPLRTLGCARARRLDVVARVCGDSPFLAPSLFERGLALMEGTDADLVSNTVVRTYPKGLSVEICPRRTLERIVEDSNDPAYRGEAMMAYVYERPGEFNIVSFRSEGPDLGRFSLAIDTPEDLTWAEALAATFGGDPAAIPDDVLLSHAASTAAAEQ